MGKLGGSKEFGENPLQEEQDDLREQQVAEQLMIITEAWILNTSPLDWKHNHGQRQKVVDLELKITLPIQSFLLLPGFQPLS